MARYVTNDTQGNRDLGLVPGDILVPYTGYDYGMRRDHESITGVEHINLSYDGETPFFTVPRTDVVML